MVRLTSARSAQPVRSYWLVAAAVACCAGLGVAIGPGFLLLAPVLALAVFAMRAAWAVPWTRAIAVFAAILGVVAAGYVWWVLGATIDADDANRAAPGATRFGGLGLLTFTACGIGLLVTGAVGASRGRESS